MIHFKEINILLLSPGVTMSLTSLGPNFLKHSMKTESQNQIALSQLPDSLFARHELNTLGLGTW